MYRIIDAPDNRESLGASWIIKCDFLVRIFGVLLRSNSPAYVARFLRKPVDYVISRKVNPKIVG